MIGTKERKKNGKKERKKERKKETEREEPRGHIMRQASSGLTKILVAKFKQQNLNGKKHASMHRKIEWQKLCDKKLLVWGGVGWGVERPYQVI